MSLAAGTKVGPYVVEAPLGAGGMGEVYRARDAKLNRDVALKILSDEFASDSDRRARFQREAQVLASLSHPNIGHIYGFEDSGTVHALVLELVEGVTLAERISRHRPPASGPRSGSTSPASQGSGLPLPEVLSIARQIAAALEAAHERGIVHRDLKPANVKVRDDGTVKVLDFGLAKAFDPSDPGRNSDSGELDLANSPTLTSPAGMTRPGVILGTAAYMSPEQARGQVVDKRTDIWAFGCVLFEMLTGRRAFTGDTVSDTIVSILSGEPEWDALPKATPDTVRDLLQRCLEKDPKRRLRDIGDTRFEMDQPGGRSGGVAGVASDAKAHRPLRRALQLIALVIVVLASAAGLLYSTRPSVPVTSSSEYVQMTNFSDSAVAPSVSPDGRMVTFKRGSDAFFSTGQIYVKPVLGGDAIQLTNDADRKYGPVFTPDSARVTYTTIAMDRPTQFNTRTVRAAGGSQPTELLPNASGLTWIAGQRVLFGEVMGEHFHMATVTASESRADRREIYLPANEGMAHFAYASPNGRSVLVVEMDQSHKFGLPCRLVPFDGSSPGGYVGPRGTCTSAAWSPDGDWMYFSASVDNRSHLWRQKFPDGVPEQITFGPSEEEGVALGPDGRWLVTSVGTRRSAIWSHDATGERAIVAEGYAASPRLSRDGSPVFYLAARELILSASIGWEPSTSELRSMDLRSGNTVSVLPGLAVKDYDISADETEVAFTRQELGGPAEIWLAPIDRRTPPRKIADKGDQVSFGPAGYLVFRSLEAGTKLVRIKKEGGVPEPVTTVPVLDKISMSPDGEWVIVFSSRTTATTPGALRGTLAVSLRGAAPRTICQSGCNAQWSSDGKFFYVQAGMGLTGVQERTVAIPVPAGQSLPVFPPSGIDSVGDAMKLAGALAIDQENVFPGLSPATYLFQKTELQRNLFRIPLH